MLLQRPGDLLFQAPRPGEPESALQPGMAAPRAQPARPALFGTTGGFPNIPDSSVPGLQALQEPGSWVYDFDPGNLSARATFNGEVQFTSGGAAGSVTSWNGRTGAVSLTAADVSAVGGAPTASPTFTGTITAPVVTASGLVTANAGLTATQPLALSGVTNGSNAAAGQIGEFMTTSSASQSLANNVALSLGSLSLTAGDWDTWGILQFVGATMSSLIACLNTVATVGNTATVMAFNSALFQGGTVAIPYQRINVSAAQNLFLVAQSAFTGTCTAAGTIYARRAR